VFLFGQFYTSPWEQNSIEAAGRLEQICAGADGIEKAAGKGLASAQSPERQTAGAKAHFLFCCTCGTTEVVPCYKTSVFP
jgi:hypothetical protein